MAGNEWGSGVSTEWSNAYTGNTTNTILSYTFALPEVAAAVKQVSESALEWLDRRVNEMRVAL